MVSHSQQSVCIRPDSLRLIGDPSSYSFIQECSFAGGSLGWYWSCTNCSDTDSLFLLHIGSIQQTNITGSLSTTTTSLSSSTVSAATTDSSHSNKVVVVAIALAIPLGLLLVLSLLWAFWERRRVSTVKKQYACLLERIPGGDLKNSGPQLMDPPQQYYQNPTDPASNRATIAGPRDNAIELSQDGVYAIPEMDATTLTWRGSK